MAIRISPSASRVDRRSPGGEHRVVKTPASGQAELGDVDRRMTQTSLVSESPRPELRRVAIVSEHASPLIPPGSPEAGGQNVHVAGLALELGRRGLDVVIYTRREDRYLPE